MMPAEVQPAAAGDLGPAADLLDEWVAWMHAGGMSQRTVTDRRYLIERLARGCDPVTCDWKQLARFLSGAHLTRGTRLTYRTNLRAWFRWLQLMDYRVDDPTAKLPKARAPRRVPRPVTTRALDVLIGSGVYSRTRTMILLAAYEGLRVHEIAKIRGEDFRDGRLRVIGKGGVEAWLPVHALVQEEAHRYPNHGWWFPSPYDRERPIRPKSVSAVISQAMERAGIPATAHQARHWFGTESLRAAGGNIRVAQELLRHASIATTANYTAVDDSDRIDAVNALPQISRRPPGARRRPSPRGLIANGGSPAARPIT